MRLKILQKSWCCLIRRDYRKIITIWTGPSENHSNTTDADFLIFQFDCEQNRYKNQHRYYEVKYTRLFTRDANTETHLNSSHSKTTNKYRYSISSRQFFCFLRARFLDTTNHWISSEFYWLWWLWCPLLRQIEKLVLCETWTRDHSILSPTY